MRFGWSPMAVLRALLAGPVRRQHVGRQIRRLFGSRAEQLAGQGAEHAVVAGGVIAQGVLERGSHQIGVAAGRQHEVQALAQ